MTVAVTPLARRRALTWLAGAVAAGVAAPARAASGQMTRESFARYIGLFNAADMGFLTFYTPDVVFTKGPPDGQLVGRDAIGQWYVRIWQDFRETLTPLAIAIDPANDIMLVELRTQLEATHDGVQWRDRAYGKGDKLIVDGTIVYTLRQGLIATIRGAADDRRVIPAGESLIP